MTPSAALLPLEDLWAASWAVCSALPRYAALLSLPTSLSDGPDLASPFSFQRGDLTNLDTTVTGATADLGDTVGGLVQSGGVVGTLVGDLVGTGTTSNLDKTVTGAGADLGDTVGGLATSGGVVGNLVGGLLGPV